MRKFLVFLFVFIFLLTVVNFETIGSLSRNTKTDKPKELVGKEKPVSKTVKDEVVSGDSLAWKTARASYYNSKSSSQTRKGCNGIGAFGREIKSGSVALGSSLTKNFMRDGVIVFIQIKDCGIVTPYGKGIFRVDDIMNSRFNKKDKFFIDFLDEDLDYYHKQLGIFHVQFKILKVISPDGALPPSGFFF